MAAQEQKPIALLTEARELAERVQPEMILGQYRLGARIGIGGMGVVHRAVHLVDEQRVAIKVLVSPQTQDRRELLSRFQLQAAMLTGLSNDNIVRIREIGCQEDLCYLVMDLVMGPEDEPVSLLDYASWFDGVIEPQELLSLFRLILSSFVYVHQHKIVHGNLKPRNVLLESVSRTEDTWEAKIRISDFGLSRILGTDFVLDSVRKSVRHQDVQAGTVRVQPMSPDAKALIETYDYMSPEQRKGKGGSRRSDLFSLGLMFFHLLTGKKVIGFEPPSRICPGINADWDMFILKATAQDRRQRFESAAEMLDALEQLTCEDTY